MTIANGAVHPGLLGKARIFLSWSIFEKAYFLDSMWARLKSKWLYSMSFGHIGARSWIKKTNMVVTPANIRIGDRVRIEKGATLYCVSKYSGAQHDGRIVIGNDVYANIGLNITVANLVEIGDEVAFGPNVFLNDFDHGYEDPEMGMIQSGLNVKQPIRIGARSWIGSNVYIGGGVSLGEHCIVGANSVVTRSFPAFSVLAGSPAKLLKTYDLQTKSWIKVTP